MTALAHAVTPSPADELERVKAENGVEKMAASAAAYGLGGIPQEQFAAEYPDEDLTEALKAQDFARRVEIASADPDRQIRCAAAQSLRQLLSAQEIVGRKLAEPDLTASAAANLTEILMRLEGLLAKRQDASRDAPPPRARVIRTIGSEIRIDGPRGAAGFIAPREAPDSILPDVVAALGCTDDAEIREVRLLIQRGGISERRYPAWS